jgi:hypothetical protein
MAVLEDFYAFAKYFPAPIRRGWASFIDTIKAGSGGGGGGYGLTAPWKWSTDVTVSDPGSGYVKVNNAAINNATILSISKTDNDGTSRTTMLDALRVNDVIIIQSQTNPNSYYSYKITGKTGNATWFQFGITYSYSYGLLVANEICNVYPVFYGASTFLQLSDTPAAYTGFGNALVAVNSGATALEFQTVASVLQRGTFLQLSDTPNTYSGQATRFVAVNSTGTALEFVVGGGGGGATTFLQLTDTPDAYAGHIHKSVRVNGPATGLEFSIIIPDWATATQYVVGDFAYADLTIWKCNTAHTSSGQTIDTTKFTRWMQANEPTTTGLISGCTLTIAGTTVTHASGLMFFVYRNPSGGSASMNYVNQVSVGTQAAAITTTWAINHFWESNDGSFFATADINETYLRSAVYLGYAVKDKTGTWIVVNRAMSTWQTGPFAQDLSWFVLGPTLLGAGIGYGTAGLQLSMGASSIFGFSVNFRPDLTQAPSNIVPIGAFSNFPMSYVLQGGSIYNVDYPEILDNFYESAPGVVTAIPAGKAAIHRIFGLRKDDGVTQYFVQMPQFYYNSIDQAVNVYFNQDETNTVIAQRLDQGAFFLGWVAVVSGAVSWPPPGALYAISPADRLGSGVVIQAPRSGLDPAKQSLDAVKGGVLQFVNLTDTPDSYLGQAAKTVVVNAAETGLEFGELPPSALTFQYAFSTLTLPNPATGTVRLNNANPALATLVYVDHVDDTGIDRQLGLGAARKNDVVSLADTNSSDVYAYRLTADAVSDPTNTYTTYTVTNIAVRGTFANNENLFVQIILFVDTPDSYTAQANKAAIVKATEDGMEFRPYTFLALMDTPSAYLGQTLKGVRVNVGETALEFYKTLTTFLELTDTPSSYSGQGTKVVSVKSAEDGLEFVTFTGGATTFLQLSDTPNSYVGQANKFVKVASAANSVVFGSATFLELTDAPASYSGQALKVVQVNSAANALEFGSSAGTAVWNANKIQGEAVANSKPLENQLLRYGVAPDQWNVYLPEYMTWQTVTRNVAGTQYHPVCTMPPASDTGSYSICEIEVIGGDMSQNRRHIRAVFVNRGAFECIHYLEDGEARGAVNFDIRCQQQTGGETDISISLTGATAHAMVRASTFRCWEYDTAVYRSDGPVYFSNSILVAFAGGTNVWNSYSQTTTFPPSLYLSENLTAPMWRGNSLAIAQLPKTTLFTQGNAVAVSVVTNVTVLNATINKPFILQMVGIAGAVSASYAMNFTVTIDGTVVINDLPATADATFPHLLGGASAYFPMVLSGNVSLLVQARKTSTGTGNTNWRASYETLGFG